MKPCRNEWVAATADLDMKNLDDFIFEPGLYKEFWNPVSEDRRL